MKTQRVNIEALKTFTRHLGEGLVPTDGVQYSAVATFGTTATEIFTALIDPGFTMELRELEVGLTQMFTGLNGSFVGSTSYYWQARGEYIKPTGTAGPSAVTETYINITGTYQKGVGTLTTSEDTFSGYVPVASLPHAPIRVRLMAQGLKAAICTGKVKNSSYVRMVGIVIPGT